MNVFVILGVLFLALVIIIPLIEKSNLRVSDESASKISRWIWPLIGLMLVLSLFSYYF